VNEASPSKTAYRVALRRAAHQIVDKPLVFEDPLALKILGPDAESKIAEADDDFISKSLRAFLVARSRFAEEELSRAVAQGVRQYVVLGAGLDTFAFRNPHEGLKVFEVDHPATQEWKRGLLAASGIEVPSAAILVGSDFEREAIADVLPAAGFDKNAPAFFAWLGVTPYLTKQAFLDGAGFVAAMPAPSGVVFDYAVARSALNFAERIALDRLSKKVAAAGEPFQLFFEPAELAQELKNFRFQNLEDLGHSELNRRYFDKRKDGLRLMGGLAHLMSAQL
jgi:methyltransferase (TIGR00027 family)